MGNRLDGRGTVSGNLGSSSALDGVQVLRRSGYGTGNAVYGNTFEGTLPGFGVRVPADDPTTVVGCDNRVPTGARAVTNIRCQP